MEQARIQAWRSWVHRDVIAAFIFSFYCRHRGLFLRENTTLTHTHTHTHTQTHTHTHKPNIQTDRQKNATWTTWVTSWIVTEIVINRWSWKADGTSGRGEAKRVKEWKRHTHRRTERDVPRPSLCKWDCSSFPPSVRVVRALGLRYFHWLNSRPFLHAWWRFCHSPKVTCCWLMPHAVESHVIWDERKEGRKERKEGKKKE